MVHDHEITFYKYGNAHQECLAHVQRYLKDSMENEPSLTWHRRMRELIREMLHYRNEHADDVHLEHKIAYCIQVLIFRFISYNIRYGSLEWFVVSWS